ncbi:MAG: male sterility protein-domain-containing protein [Monoraphidium minutum]|nr:MAG: male sterility protein-domain-containing protein [Monoraphidium minutum]
MTLGEELPYVAAGAAVADAPAAPQSPPASDDSAGSGGFAGLYSIRGHFDASSRVFLTGATGYIGSLVLEKLLRSTAVGKVYVLVRARRGTDPRDRAARLLRGPLFHLCSEADAARVVAVAGDIMQPGLGLSAEDEALLARDVDTVLHSAADIRLEAPIQDTLTANYRGTLSVVRLAARMQRLKSFVYISTCYANMNRPRGSLVEERLYPVMVDGREFDTSHLAEELLAMPAAEANERAADYIRLWGFRNTYAFGKHLAEKAVAAVQRELDLPAAIVRPSLVSAIFSEPYPGYSGNYAGPVGMAAAYITGFHDDQPEAVASDAYAIWDIVPGDICVQAIIAAAAAVASPAARACICAPRGEECPAGRSQAAPLMVVQIATSTTYPVTTAKLFNDTVIFCAAFRRPFTLALGRMRGMEPDQRYDDDACNRIKKIAAGRVGPLVWMLRKMGGKAGKKMASLLSVGMRTFETINTKKYDLDTFFDAANLLRLEAALAPEEAGDFQISWRAPPRDRFMPATAAARLDGGKAAAAIIANGGAPAPGEGPPPAPGGCAAADKIAADAAETGSASGSESKASRIGARHGDAAAAPGREADWTVFNYNAFAYLYKSLFNKKLAGDAKIPARRVKKLMPFFGAPEVEATRRVHHTFVVIKAGSS